MGMKAVLTCRRHLWGADILEKIDPLLLASSQ